MDTLDVNDPHQFENVVPLYVANLGGKALSEHIQLLIDAGQKEKAREILEAEILKGMDSGPAEPWTEEDLACIRAEVIRRCEARKTGE
jgi:hypothetical protein